MGGADGLAGAAAALAQLEHFWDRLCCPLFQDVVRSESSGLQKAHEGLDPENYFLELEVLADKCHCSLCSREQRSVTFSPTFVPLRSGLLATVDFKQKMPRLMQL